MNKYTVYYRSGEGGLDINADGYAHDDGVYDFYEIEPAINSIIYSIPIDIVKYIKMEKKK